MERSLQFFKKHTNLFSKWLLPYVILLIVPLVINIYTYSMMDGIVYDQTVSTNAMALSQVKQNVDKVLSEVHQAYLQLFSLDMLKAEHIADDPSAVQYNGFKAMETLNPIASAYPSISSIVLYNRASDFIVTPRNASGSRSYYDAFNPFGNATYEEFSQMLQGKYSGSFTESHIVSRSGEPTTALIYQKSIIDIHTSSYGYNVFFILEDSMLYNQLQETDLFQNGLFAILDKQDSHIITTQGDTDLRPLLEAKLQGETASADVITAQTDSEIFNLEYHMLMPENRFWAEKRSIRRMFSLSILLCLILGVLVIVSSVKHNYTPLKKLSEIIRRKGDTLQSDNDLMSVYQSAGNMIEQYSRVLSTQNAGLRTAFLQRFMRGREEGETLLEHFKTYHIDFAGDDFFVALIYIEDYGAFFEGAEHLSRDEQFGFVHLTFTNIFEELCADFCLPYYVDLDYTIGYIINLKPNTKNKLRETLAQTQEFVKEHFGILTSIGISGRHQSASGVPLAYNQALEALDYRTVLGTETIIEYGQIRHDSEIYYPLDLEQQLLGCLKAGKPSEAQKTLDLIYQSNLSAQSLSSDAARCLMFNLIGTMMKALSLGGEAVQTNGIGEQYISRLFACKSLKEMHGIISEMMQDICRANQKEGGEKDDLISGIIAYVQENYRDPSLSVSALAEHFGFHSTYLSNVFKSKTGGGLFDFIKEVRINAAKTLLKENDETVTAIAEQCGFTNSKTFTRTFKSVTGLTPGKFREI